MQNEWYLEAIGAICKWGLKYTMFERLFIFDTDATDVNIYTVLTMDVYEYPDIRISGYH